MSIESFLENGALNKETIYLDEDAKPLAGHASLSIGGIFTFRLNEVDNTLSLLPSCKSTVLQRWLAAVNAKQYTTPSAALVAATEEYINVCDELDAENAEEETEVDEEIGDACFVEEVVEAKPDAKRKEDMAREAEIERLRQQYGSTKNKQAIDRLLADFYNVKANKHFGWSAEPEGRDLFTWHVKFFDAEKGTALASDLEQYKKASGREAAIELRMKFPPEYPFKPPFIRVIRPRFQFRTGHVTIGGSICTEMLTDDGWKPVLDIEAIMETIRTTMFDTQSGARIDLGNSTDYSEDEAVAAFNRMVQAHKQSGW
jgi:ubiquitin-conjugating enzyme E2 Q